MRQAKTKPAAPALTRRRLLAWYRQERRSLPWRETSDPYHVLVSEIMLQQTRVSAVIPYYKRFLSRFPTVNELAGASVEEVLGLWSGLGYYGRARRLHEAAKVIVRRHAGAFPRQPDAVRELPGVGRYTAGAVLSIAFQQAEAVVDGNVARVLSRLRGIEGDVRTGPVSRRLWTEAERLLDPQSPGDFNQALMELGATVCLPVRPECSRCPVAEDCVARISGRQAELPSPRARKAVKKVLAAAVVVRRGERYLLVQRPTGGLLGGLWEFPGVEPDAAPVVLARALCRTHHLDIEVGKRLGHVTHAILERRIRLGVYLGHLRRAPTRTAGRSGWRWSDLGEDATRRLPLAASARKIARLLEVEGLPHVSMAVS